MRVVTAVTRLSALALAVALLVLLSPSSASACGISYQDGVSVQDCPSTPPVVASVVLAAAAAATLIVLGVAAFRRGKRSATDFVDLLRTQLPPTTAGRPPTSGVDGWEGEGGLHLSPEENAAADRFLAQARDAESTITPVVMAIKDEVPGTQTAGYPDFVLKDPESFKRKLATTLSDSPTRDLDAALADMKDSVRYTFKFPSEGTAYADGVNTAIGRFQDAGFENVRFKNTWGGDDYTGINSFWRDPRTGHVFEMQFHTQESFDAKMVNHEKYEQTRIQGLPEAEALKLKAEMKATFRAVPRPTGATDIALPGS
jgi:hypothetical protein